MARQKKKHAEGAVSSIDKVRDELVDDELAAWADGRDASFFRSPDDAVLPALATVSEWATSQNYESSAVSTFLQIADFWLVAEALAHDCVVVTHEVPRNFLTKIQIPNACVGLDVDCISPYAMLRRERARFVLGER